MYKSIYKTWLASDKLKKEEDDELKSLNEKDIEYRFGKELEFGTAGMRGIIGLGTNMMNVYTVRRATQGLANYIKTLEHNARIRGVVISYDTRRFSFEFALETAIVLVSNGIKAYLFNDVHPVPMLSFAVRNLNAVAGVMITASHNPKEYNGYKVYGEDGAQMSPEATAEVVKYITEIKDVLSDDVLYYKDSKKFIKSVPKAVDKRYYSTIKKLSLSKKQGRRVGRSIKLVYTPVHGSGYIPVITILKKIGIHTTVVPEQIKKDSEFSTVKVPNPELAETLTLAIKMADFKKADVVFGTDPDADRLGVAIRNDKGNFVALSGNQIGILLLDYILRRLKEKKKLPANAFVVKSFVSTSMAKLIADDYGVELIETPVGFKYIGEKIKELDDSGIRKFLFGFEESCGFLRGTHCRDKDAVVASMLFAEMVCYYTYNKIGIYQRLMELYNQYGYIFDTNISTVYSGLNAMDEMQKVVDKFRNITIDSIGGVEVLEKRDYLTLKCYEKDGFVKNFDSSKANAIYYLLNGGSFVCVRPSGTEPKLKVYYSIKGKNQSKAENLFKKVKEDFEKYLQ